MQKTQLAPGYYRDADTIFYVTEAGQTYLVSSPDSEEPRWERYDGFEYHDDAEPTTLCAEDRELFEQIRLEYDIPE